MTRKNVHFSREILLTVIDQANNTGPGYPITDVSSKYFPLLWYRPNLKQPLSIVVFNCLKKIWNVQKNVWVQPQLNSQKHLKPLTKVNGRFSTCLHILPFFIMNFIFADAISFFWRTFERIGKCFVSYSVFEKEKFFLKCKYKNSFIISSTPGYERLLKIEPVWKMIEQASWSNNQRKQN